APDTGNADPSIFPLSLTPDFKSAKLPSPSNKSKYSATILRAATRRESRSGRPARRSARMSHKSGGEGINCRSVEAGRFHQQRKWIEAEIVRETLPEKAQPTILRDIGELLALLRALMLETKHILKMMDHLMNQNRKLDRCFAPPAFRQIDGVCGVIVEGERIALRRCCLIVGGDPSSGRRE